MNERGLNYYIRQLEIIRELESKNLLRDEVVIKFQEVIVEKLLDTPDVEMSRANGEAQSTKQFVTNKLNIFYSYSHADKDLRERLDTHLSLLRREELIASWHDYEVSAGKEFENEIDVHLNTAHIVLLLISPDFIASDHCFNKEMMCAMERHKAGYTRVIPILLRSTDWHTAPFGNLRVLPRNGKPIDTWLNPDEAFLDVAIDIRRVVEELSHIQAL